MSVETFIGGADVTGTTLSGSVTRRLNRPAQATCRIPMDLAIGEVGDLLRIDIDSSIFFHGRILTIEDSGGEDTGYSEYTAMDAMELWQWRPVRDDDGDFSRPDIIANEETGPQIIRQMLLNSESAGAGPPSDAEGDLFLAYGTFEGGGVSLTGAPVDWPMTIAELATLLTSTGEVDIIITPIDAGGKIGQVDVYNGDYGTDLSGSVAFQYATGANNVREVRRNQDMTQLCNKLWYYGGPRIETAADPEGNQHWCWNITGDDPGLANPPGGDIDYSNPLGDLRLASQAAYGIRMDVQIFDALGDLCLGEGAVDPGRELYRRLWQAETLLRAQPRTLVHVTPTRNTGIGDFDIGDLITVEAGSVLRGGFSGVQRVYAYTVNWDEDGVEWLGELQSSEDAEAV